MQELSVEQSEEIQFWTPQMREHSLFIYLGLEPVPFVASDPLIESYMNNRFNVEAPKDVQELTVKKWTDVTRYKAESLLLYKNFDKHENDIVKGSLNFKEYQSIVQKLSNLKSNVIKLQESGTWVGWLYPGFTKHIKKELDYFWDRLHNNVSATDEVKFWIDINADHAGFAARLLDAKSDPNHRQLVDSVMDISEEGYALSEEQMDFQQMIRLTSALDYAEKVGDTQLQMWNSGRPDQRTNIVHPILLAHVIRENERSQVRLKQLGINPNKQHTDIVNRLIYE